MKLALRVEVSTLRGTREDAPRLATLLQEHDAGATFLFSLGPDHTGRALGDLPAVPKLGCYGALALLSGTLLPARDIGIACAGEMRSISAQGFEAGILAFDRADWVRHVDRAGDAWTRTAMQRAHERFEQIFGAAALTHGAPGWRMNRHAYRYTQRLGYRHCSDTRGTSPFIPVVNGEITACPQLPTTLPAFDELLTGGVGTEAAVRRLLELSRNPPAGGHVYTLRAEIEGRMFEPAMRALLGGWRDMGYSLVSLHDYAAKLSLASLPRRMVIEQPQPDGTHGPLSSEGDEFLVQR
jgi:undecaprenyl phosphate-alpha-L-ara4FN deformylase